MKTRREEKTLNCQALLRPPSSPEHPAATSSPPHLEDPLRTVPKVPKMLRDIADHNKPGAGEEARERPTRLRSGR